MTQIAWLRSRWAWPTACSVLLVLSAWWALAPLRDPQIQIPELVTRDTPEATVTRIDESSFRVPLWVTPMPPPEPPAPEAPLPPPAPLRLQLIAVVDNDDAFSAVLYDPDADRLLIVGPGERIADGRVVENVSRNGIVISAQDGTHTLALRDAP